MRIRGPARWYRAVTEAASGHFGTELAERPVLVVRPFCNFQRLGRLGWHDPRPTWRCMATSNSSQYLDGAVMSVPIGGCILLCARAAGKWTGPSLVPATGAGECRMRTRWLASELLKGYRSCRSRCQQMPKRSRSAWAARAMQSRNVGGELGIPVACDLDESAGLVGHLFFADAAACPKSTAPLGGVLTS